MQLASEEGLSNRVPVSHRVADDAVEVWQILVKVVGISFELKSNPWGIAFELEGAGADDVLGIAEVGAGFDEVGGVDTGPGDGDVIEEGGVGLGEEEADGEVVGGLDFGDGIEEDAAGAIDSFGWFMMRWKVARTSLLVKGEPSWN